PGAGGRRGPGDRLQSVAMAAVMLVCAVFFAVSALTGPPVVPAAADGPGPGALLHLGSAALAVPFGHGVAWLVTGRTETGTIRRWTLAAWVPLTAGIVLGAWWSYRALGWGGSWEWDPVENGALMPWLLATALLHAAPSRAMRPWVAPLALTAFLLVPFGMFLAAHDTTPPGSALPVTVLPVTALAGAALLAALTVTLAGARALLARYEPRHPARRIRCCCSAARCSPSWPGRCCSASCSRRPRSCCGASGRRRDRRTTKGRSSPACWPCSR
ncbi:cytochrome c biogenesis protein CcsA, partial [Nonomuraea wenchangensis]|uniref:cytochrome c biogenesis protein CcsA n=1 Tax=Nonomuraea wenchangensis TaxID=568860 RepID=UPI0033212F7B